MRPAIFWSCESRDDSESVRCCGGHEENTRWQSDSSRRTCFRLGHPGCRPNARSLDIGFEDGQVPRGVSFEAAIIGERWAANAPDGESVVFHRWSDLMIILASDGSVRSVVRGIETIELPKAVLVSRSVDGWDFKWA